MVSRRPNIWKLQANKDVDGLIESLSYSDPDIRKRAAAALRVLGVTSAVSALQEALKRERHPDVRDHLTATLEHLDAAFAQAVTTTKNRDELIALLSASDSDQIVKACQALGELGDQLATEALVMIFRNSLQLDNVRLAAAEALLALKSAPAVATLLAGLKKDSWRIRHNSATVLGQLRATWATEPLIKALGDDHPNVRLAAAAALSRFRTPRALQAVEAYQAKRTGKTQPLPLRPEVSQAGTQTEEAVQAPAPTAPSSPPDQVKDVTTEKLKPPIPRKPETPTE